MARFVRVTHEVVCDKATEEITDDTLDQDTMRRIAKAVASATNYDVNVDELTFIHPEDIIRFSKNENKAVLLSSMLQRFQDTDAQSWKVVDMKKLLLLANVSTTGVYERSHIVELVTNLLPAPPAKPLLAEPSPDTPPLAKPPAKQLLAEPPAKPPPLPPPSPEKTIRKKKTSIVREPYNMRKR